mmetsp:Transcript_120448/g.341266  ORF Transcript_120448/g.341266 Transcript_120448/m.341266 type:complete len:253 (-) Transcript_120448:1727-2485(-)
MHRELADGGHHLARHVLDARLEDVHLLRQLHGALAPVHSLLPQLVRQRRDLLQDKLLLQEALLLVVEPLLQVVDLDPQLLRVQVLPAEFPPLPQRALRVLKLAGEVVRALPDARDLLPEPHHLIDEPGDLGDSALDHAELALRLLEVDVQTPDLLGPGEHRVLALLEELLLDVRLLPEDAQLVVAVDELRAREVPRLDRLLVLPPEEHHLFLDRVDDGVQLVDFNDVLLDILIELLSSCGDEGLFLLELVVD